MNIKLKPNKTKVYKNKKINESRSIKIVDGPNYSLK